MSSEASVRAVLSGVRCVLLDFDGPICAVFSGISASSIAANLRRHLTEVGVPIPEALREESDPIEVLRSTATIAPELALEVEDVMRVNELRAVDEAVATPYAAEVLRACRGSGRRVIVVSNNSGHCVEHYLARHHLSDYVAAIVGRPPGLPYLMKPNRHLVDEAIRAAGARKDATVLIGDSVTRHRSRTRGWRGQRRLRQQAPQASTAH